MIGQTPPEPTPEPGTQSSENGTTTPGGQAAPQAPLAREFGGRDGLEPTRYGDWEKNGRCVDF
ncbi:DUF1674 domain-containing protein [Pseudoxanthomonas indica]|uniref:DUF1674 domain-containing protein n=1 Tax=Pseudoxanthomonas indica TaxID=428993 RepID=UPI0009A7B6E7|nr:DUF1674 domain-containing protein [Pseudoxanthomonas indica]